MPAKDEDLLTRDPLIGKIVNNGQFIVKSILGTGAWGRVYLAGDTISAKDVAIKVLHCHLVTDQQMLHRFEREARSGFSIKHPNICEIFSQGLLPTGQPFIAMEYLSGENLAALLRRETSLRVADAMEIFLSCAEALRAAHAQRIVHRDIKPANIIIVDGANTRLVKLLDFGMAKILAEQNDLTQTGPGFGTVHYMSPEQVLGDPVDSRSDIYSLGCVMYEALSGRKVFSGRTAFEVMEQHIKKTPLRLAGTSSDVPIPPKLDAAVLRSLDKAPSQRFQSATELIEALKDVAVSMNLHVS